MFSNLKSVCGVVGSVFGIMMVSNATFAASTQDVIPALVNPKIVEVTSEPESGLEIQFQFRSCSGKTFRAELKEEKVTVYMPVPQMECFGPTILRQYRYHLAPLGDVSVDRLVIVNPIIEDSGAGL